MAANIKFDVEMSGFISNIKQGQTTLKGLNAELKVADAEFKATGDAEKKATTQAKALSTQITVQKGIIKQAEQALKAMKDNGVKATDKEYQDMCKTLTQAQIGMYEAQAAMNGLGKSAEEAAQGASELTTSVNSIGKKISLDQVISGINTITNGLENAAKKAIQLGESIWNSIMDSAKWADDTATMAQMYGIDLDTFQRMQKLVTNGLDTTVEAMIKSQQKLTKNIGDGSKNAMEALQDLHIGMRKGILEDWTSWEQKDPSELFWEVGDALMNMSDAYDKESAAQALFGRSWHELIPLFSTYKSAEEYSEALEGVQVVSEESVNALAELNDKYGELKGNFDTLSGEMLGKLAPALTQAADALNGLLTSILEYLKTPEGQQALEDMGTAVSGLFDDLGKIDPETVVEGFTSVFNTVVDSLKWLVENKDTMEGVLAGVVAAWGALKISGGVLTIVKLISGIQGLAAGGAATAAGAATAGANAGAAFASGFSEAFVAGAPVLASMLGVTAVAVAPALIAGENDKKRWKNQYESRMEAANLPDDNAWFVSRAAEALGLTGQVDFGATDSLLMGLASRQNQQKAELYNLLSGSTTAGSSTWNVLNSYWQGAELDQFVVDELLQDITDAFAENAKKAEVPVEVTVPDDAAEQISEQVGTVRIHGYVEAGPEGGFANGLPYVPYDGFLARLHKGERVVPAREASRSFNSNLYVENMVMNNGTDAAGLAASIAAAQRRTMSGYGS